MRVYAQKPSQPRRHSSFGLMPTRLKAPAGPQTKLKVNTPGDVYEREADRIAEEVMRAPGTQLQRACACGGSAPERREEEPRDEDIRLQTKSARAGEAEAEAPPAVEEVLRSPGQPLAPSARDFFAPRFGHDFSRVRVHTDERAAESARSLNALAYTVGRHVVFGAGQYAPGTGDGRRLLAHELTHVLQQSGRQGGGPPAVQRLDTGEEPQETPAETPETAADAPQFTYDPGLDPELKARFNRMVIALNKAGIGHGGIDGVRPVKRAHILSTAYHIHTKQAVSLSDLQALPGGKDEDGNTWYRQSWEQMPSSYWGLVGPREATTEEIMELARENAFAQAQLQGSGYVNVPTFSANTINCAYEGYAAGDSHRKPNVDAVPMSNHVIGRAIDLDDIKWEKLGGSWSTTANKFVASFGLTRPYTETSGTYCIAEPWHFELAPDAPTTQPPSKGTMVPKK